MKRLKLLTLLGCLLAGASLTACSNDNEEGGTPSAEPIEVEGYWKVVSWTEDGISDSEHEGLYWSFTATQATLGSEAPVSYACGAGKLRIGICEYAVRKIDADRIELQRGGTTIVLQRVSEIPGPAGPAGPEQARLTGCTVFPAGGNAYKDAWLTVKFDGAPTLGTTGEIRIFRASDKQEVDRIDLAEVAAARVRLAAGQTICTTHDVIGPKSLRRYRIVNYEPATIAGNELTIRPHYDVLEYDTDYYVTIDKEAVVAAGFEGVAAGEWTFTTKAAPTSKTVTVGETGADFRTVQAALDYGFECGRDAAVEIRILPGEYEEQLFMRYNNNITLKGMGARPEEVRIHYRNGDDLNGGVGGSTSVSGNPSGKPRIGDEIGYAGGRTVMLIESCDNLRMENLTLENTRGIGAQAEALYNNDNSGDCGMIAVKCRFLGYQDTLNLKGYCWFYDCLVAGDVDFIWGGATAALFEACEIRTMTDGAYIVNARVNQDNGYRKGFVFLNCRLTKGTGVHAGTSWLARHGEDKSNDNVTYVDCRMDDHIASAGWYKNDAAKFTPSPMTALHGLKEYGTTTLAGGAYDLSSRLSCAHALTAAEVEAGYKDRRTILTGYSKSARWEE